MMNAFTKFKKQHEIMLNTFSYLSSPWKSYLTLTPACIPLSESMGKGRDGASVIEVAWVSCIHFLYNYMLFVLSLIQYQHY